MYSFSAMCDAILEILFMLSNLISESAERMRRLGQKWEDALAEAYLQMNDKTYLDRIVAGIEAEAAQAGVVTATSIPALDGKGNV